jgi:hypothetical protein
MSAPDGVSIVPTRFRNRSPNTRPAGGVSGRISISSVAADKTCGKGGGGLLAEVVDQARVEAHTTSLATHALTAPPGPAGHDRRNRNETAARSTLIRTPPQHHPPHRLVQTGDHDTEPNKLAGHNPDLQP